MDSTDSCRDRPAVAAENLKGDFYFISWHIRWITNNYQARETLSTLYMYCASVNETLAFEVEPESWEPVLYQRCINGHFYPNNVHNITEVLIWVNGHYVAYSAIVSEAQFDSYGHQHYSWFVVNCVHVHSVSLYSKVNIASMGWPHPINICFHAKKQIVHEVTQAIHQPQKKHCTHYGSMYCVSLNETIAFEVESERWEHPFLLQELNSTVGWAPCDQ